MIKKKAALVMIQLLEINESLKYMHTWVFYDEKKNLRWFNNMCKCKRYLYVLM